MNIIKVSNEDRLKYKELLLLADEQMDMVEKYLYRGDMFLLNDGGVKAECVVTREEEGRYELKNIAVDPEYHGQGYGKELIRFIADYYKDMGTEIYVGTGDCPGILRFYEQCGFDRAHVIKNFFVDNYDHPMYEDGKQLVDMVYLKRPLSS